MIDFTKLKIGDIVSIHFPKTNSNEEFYELAIVEDTDRTKRYTSIRPLTQNDRLNIWWDQTTTHQICDLVMTPMLRNYLFSFHKDVQIGFLPTKEDVYILPMSQNGIEYKIIIKQEDSQWVLVELESDTHFGVRFHKIGRSFRQFQNVIRKVFGIEISRSVLDSLTTNQNEIANSML